MRSSSSNVFVAVLTVIVLVALTGYQVTSETSAVRLLGRLGASMVELDRWLPAHRDDIELLARDRPDQPLVLDELPVDVTIPAPAALDAPQAVLSATIREAMGRRIYDEGYGVIQGDDGESHLGLTEPLRWAIDGLDSSAHGFWRLVLLISGLTLAVVCLGHLWVRASPVPGLAVGSAVAAVGALGVWLAVSFIGSSAAGSLNEELAAVAKDSTWLGVRNTLAATAIGLGALYVQSTLSRPRDDWEEWDEYDYEPGEPERRESPPY